MRRRSRSLLGRPLVWSHSLSRPSRASRSGRPPSPARSATGQWQPGRGTHVERHRLFPFDMTAFPRRTDAGAPLLNLVPEALLSELTPEYVYAQLCKAALHAFAAENEARMEAMASARQQIERQLSSLRATQRIVRQEGITAEIIELAASRSDQKRSQPQNDRLSKDDPNQMRRPVVR